MNHRNEKGDPPVTNQLVREYISRAQKVVYDDYIEVDD